MRNSEIWQLKLCYKYPIISYAHIITRDMKILSMYDAFLNTQIKNKMDVPKNLINKKK